MKISLTPMIESDEVQIWADVFPEGVHICGKFSLSAKPASFEQRALFTQDKGEGPLLTISKDEAKELAEELLKMLSKEDEKMKHLETITENFQTNSPNWDRVVTDQGYAAYLNSIHNILEGILTGCLVDFERAKDGSAGFSVGTIYLFGIAAMADGGSEFKDIECRRGRGTQKAREVLIKLLEYRWIDCLWSMHDGINERISFIQRFYPKYRSNVQGE